MQFSTVLHEQQLSALWHEFVNLIGPDPWEKRIKILVQQSNAGPLQKQLIEERFPLECAFLRIYQDWKASGRIRVDKLDKGDYGLFGMANTVISVFKNIDEPARKRICGAMLHALNKSRAGLASFAFELTTAVHLSNRGFNVTFADMEQKSRFDYLAEHPRNGAVVEVECKVITTDKSSQIHFDSLLDLLRHLEPIALRTLDSSGGKYIKIQVPSRLSRHYDTQKAIAEQINAAIAQGDGNLSSDVCEVNYRNFDIHERFNLLEFLRQNCNLGHTHISIIGNSRNNSMAVFEILSKIPNSLTDGIYSVAKDSAKEQFSRSNPAVLAIQLPDLTTDQLLELHRTEASGPNDFQKIATRLFNEDSRKHIHTVAFLSSSDIARYQTSEDGKLLNIIQGQGRVYIFKNRNHFACDDTRYNLFS